VDLVTGAFYLDRKSPYSGTVDQGPLIFFEDDSIPASNWAAFAHASWRVTDKLEANFGVRYSEEEKTFNFGRGSRPGASGPPYFPCVVNGVNYGIVHAGFCGLNGAQGKYSGDNVDYRGVIQYQWTPAIMTYASIATGFKGGGVNPRPYFPDQARPFDPETVTAYEIGLKSSLLDRKLQVNLSGFVNKYSDFIASVFSRTATAPNTGCYFNTSELSCSFFENAGKATVQGAEAEVQYQPVRGLMFDLSASLLDFKYDKLSGCAPGFTPGCTAPSGGLGAGIRYGMKLPYAPAQKFSAGVQYEFALGGGSTLTPRFDVNYQSRQEANTINNALAKLQPYSVMNARLAWSSADKDWQVAAQVANLANKLYYTGVGQSNNTWMVTAAPAAPREWSLTVRRSFGL
jgi:iron complex outermembrane receptor protein